MCRVVALWACSLKKVPFLDTKNDKIPAPVQIYTQIDTVTQIGIAENRILWDDEQMLQNYHCENLIFKFQLPHENFGSNNFECLHISHGRVLTSLRRKK